MTKQTMARKLETLINAIMIAYWAQETPKEFAKAWDHACKVLDQVKTGRRISEKKVWDALEWLCEASKHDDKVMAQITGAGA